MYSDEAFCAVIKEKGLKIKAVAAAMGIKTSTLYRKRRGISEFLRSEIQRFGEFVGDEYVDSIFFAKKVA